MNLWLPPFIPKQSKAKQITKKFPTQAASPFVFLPAHFSSEVRSKKLIHPELTQGSLLQCYFFLDSDILLFLNFVRLKSKLSYFTLCIGNFRFILGYRELTYGQGGRRMRCMQRAAGNVYTLPYKIDGQCNFAE